MVGQERPARPDSGTEWSAFQCRAMARWQGAASITSAVSQSRSSELFRLVLASQDAGEAGDREGGQDQSDQHLGHIKEVEDPADREGQGLLAVQLGSGKRYLG